MVRGGRRSSGFVRWMGWIAVLVLDVDCGEGGQGGVAAAAVVVVVVVWGG